MESSFFEYRDKTRMESDSDTEIIDGSLVMEDSFISKKKLAGKNQTVFVAQSDSYTEDESDAVESGNKETNLPKSFLRQSNMHNAHVISSSDDNASRGGSILRPSEKSSNKVVVSSSDESEGDASPELLPRRRPPIRPKSNSSTDTSIIGRCRRNKRMILQDSDTENSIIIEHNKHKKLTCLKDTPLKLDQPNKAYIRKASCNDSQMDHGDDQNQSGYEISGSADDKTESYNETRYSDDKTDESHNETHKSVDKSDVSDNENSEGDVNSSESDGDDEQSDDDGPDEDQMVLSRATRMSIMGVIPKHNGDDNSDESDFIQSDEKSRSSSSNSMPESLPDIAASIHDTDTPEKEATQENETSRLSCSPFTSPLRDVTNSLNQSHSRKNKVDKSETPKIGAQESDAIFEVPDAKCWNDDEVTLVDDKDLKSKVLSNIAKTLAYKENVNDDDDVTIIDAKPEIIALSSDDEEDKPPVMKKSPKATQEASTSQQSRQNLLEQYLAPPSYPNQAVVYVKKHVRDNELSKLEKLRADLHNVKNLLEEMDLSTLPDGGIKLIERLSGLEQQVRQQGDTVANMVVEPDQPTKIDKARDGFADIDPDLGLSWDEIQKQSNAVQPRMFGRQAMATHLAERNLILERLSDLHKSLDTRPPESQRAGAPRGLSTALMPHQLHALAWLQWRETQSPVGGILADDMGLGKTITMISLILADKAKKTSNDEDDDEEEYAGKGRARLVHGGTLVVCPASLMQQWAAEVGKHCGSAHALSVCQHHGSNRATLAQRLAMYDLVLTTYNIIQRDTEKNGVLMKIRWRRIILDEAHIVRNHKSLTCAGVCALPGRRRWALTGTPVQNKDLDLFALLKFLKCTPFDDITMWKKWIDKSLGGQERLSTIMRCILLRRTKLQLQQKGQLDCLPEKNQHLEEVILTKEEMNVYHKVLVFSKSLFSQFLHQRAEKQSSEFAPSTSQKDSAYAVMHKKMIALQGAKPVQSHQILVLLLRLRQVCCHCGLIAAMLDDADDTGEVAEDPAGQDLLAELNKLSLEDAKSKRKSGQKETNEEDEQEEEGTTVTEAIRSVMSPNNPVFELTRQSSKIKAVMKCLKKNVFVNKGAKAVVVSQWTSVLRLVENYLREERIQCVTLSGEVPVPARAALVQKLNDPKSDVRVMLLSLCAGGVGLNLMGANHLLLMDPHWNPQLEEQAQDRIYRVGQTKSVHIYRFMCVDTVEQSIRQLQQNKLKLAENVLTGAKHNNASKLSIEDLKVLFNMGPVGQ